MIYEVRQNIEGKFFYQVMGDVVGPFENEDDARREGLVALNIAEGTKTNHQHAQAEICPSCKVEISVMEAREGKCWNCGRIWDKVQAKLSAVR